jgi:O-antigen/teichoic acid export membrane protein
VSSFLKRVYLGAGANAYGQAVTILIQLVSVPVFLSQWSLETYGHWLILSAIPTYISLSDVGVVTVAGNRMNMMISSGDVSNVNRVFQSAQVFTYFVCGLVFTATVAFCLLPTPFLNGSEEKGALAFLVMGVLIGQLGGLSEAVFKATKGYAIGTTFAATARCFEWLGFMCGLFLAGTFTAVALGGLCGRLIIVALAYVRSSKRHPQLVWGFRYASFSEIRGMLKPAFSFLLFTLSNALTFQGFTLLCGFLFGPAATVVFTTYRTLARVAVQTSSMLSHALWPEFTALFAQGRGDRLWSVYKRASLGNLGMSIGMCAALFFVSGPLLTVWTHGELTLEPVLMSILLGYAAIAGCGHLPRVVLMATNKHTSLGLCFAFVSILSLALGWYLGRLLGVTGLATAMACAEAITVVTSLLMVRRLLMRIKEGKVGQFT